MTIFTLKFEQGIMDFLLADECFTLQHFAMTTAIDLDNT